MKIAFLTPEFPHLKTGTSGGIGTSILNLSKGLVQLEHQVTILVYGQDEDAIFEDNNITFYRIKNVIVKGLSTYFTQKKIQKIVNSLYENNKIEILEVPDWTGSSAFIDTECPIVMRLNGSDTYFCHLDKRPVKWKNKFLEKRAFKKADKIISVSQFTGDLTNELFDTKRNFEVIPNAVDTSRFENLVLENKGNTILYFGTLIRKKGLLELPCIFNEVYKKNPQAELILVGKDASDILSGNKSTWKMMQELFDEEALNQVHYLGSVSYSEIKKQIEKATVCVFPTFAEALPVSWIEAMAMKRPVVASNIGWAKEVIDDGINGFLVDPKSHVQFAERICRILDNKELQNVLGNKASEKAISSFDSLVIAEKSSAFYKKML